MPIYTYRCKECDHEFEVRQRMTDDPLTECPVCHGEIRRVVNSVGVVFKGKGFYVTDNRSGQNASLAAGKSEKTEKSGGSDSGSESATSKEGSTSNASENSKKETKTEKATSTAV